MTDKSDEDLDLKEKITKPVAWRKKVGHQWHYLNQNDPFPNDDWEPLFTKEQLK